MVAWSEKPKEHACTSMNFRLMPSQQSSKLHILCLDSFSFPSLVVHSLFCFMSAGALLPGIPFFPLWNTKRVLPDKYSLIQVKIILKPEEFIQKRVSCRIQSSSKHPSPMPWHSDNPTPCVLMLIYDNHLSKNIDSYQVVINLGN